MLTPVETQVLAVCKRHGADKILLLTDSNVDPLTAGMFSGVPRLVVEAGEGSKSIASAEKIWRFLIDNKALRRSVLLNVGGGMITDLGGFAAALFKRGIATVNLPTTLLASVDAAIGGKTGVNFEGLKNEIGAFALPLAVFPLTSLFGSLPEEEWLSGVGEAVKTALLDSESLLELATSEAFVVRREPEVVEEVVRRCAAFKQKIVDEDFREKGLRKILNLGHTAGHAIESWKMSRGEYLPHGIAVAYGLRIALEQSCSLVGCDGALLEKIDSFVSRYFPPLELNEKDWQEIEAFMLHDKKNVVEGKPEWVLLRGVGKPVV